MARSNEVKALGIPMGAPVHQVRAQIQAHSIQAYSSNYTLYGDLSQRVMQTLEQFSPDVEVYSEELWKLQAATASYVARAAVKLRREGLVAKVMTVFITTSQFQPSTAQYANSETIVLPYPTNDTPTFVKAALRFTIQDDEVKYIEVLAHEIWHLGQDYVAGLENSTTFPVTWINGDYEGYEIIRDGLDFNSVANILENYEGEDQPLKPL